MNHIHLDAQDEAVKRFFLSLPIDPLGSVVELNGQAVACILPPPNEQWTEVKIERRGHLLDRKFYGPPLTPAEIVELAGLEDELLRFRNRVTPLPIEEARRQHPELF